MVPSNAPSWVRDARIPRLSADPGPLRLLLLPHCPPMPSSDPADDSGVMYLSITTFIETLIAKVPQHHSLREVADTLDSLHFYEINEIATLTAAELGSEKFGNAVLGDAQYLLMQVGKEVKRLEKLARCARLQ
ncbi:hypothetical protein B0H14DRAFT_865942 [Mycena olivaceomarginata]|nr:hypothetical protein B0H14DRAFT_865942 [Mycena olivaceomarginata]